MRSLPRFGVLLHDFGRRLQAALDAAPQAAAEEDRDHVLPIVAALLEGRRAADAGDGEAAWTAFAAAGLRLAMLACPSGPAELRLLDFARRQRRRLAVGTEAGLPAWWEQSDRHHFDRALTHGVRVAYLLDVPAGETSRRSLPDEAADAANYLLFFLAVRCGSPAGAAAASAPGVDR